MPERDKNRVAVALYASGKKDPDAYHWAIIVSPKFEKEGTCGERYRPRQCYGAAGPSHWMWKYECLNVTLNTSIHYTGMLLGRIIVGKVTDNAQLEETLARVPIVQDAAWDSREWVKEALAALAADEKSLGTRITDWTKIEDVAKAYVGAKRKKGRFDETKNWIFRFAPTFDLLRRKELHS